MKQFAWLLSVIVLGTILIPACTDPTEIGADLLDGDKAEVGFTDTLTLTATTIEGDSILTYFPVNNAAQAFRQYLVGEMIDPIFGKSKAEVYAQLTLSELDPNFDLLSIDSVVLVLPLDSTNFYGNKNETYSLAVHRITEDMNPLQNYFSNSTFQTESTPIGTHSFTPNFDSVTVFQYGITTTDTLSLPAQVRVPLPITFGEELLGLDTTIFQTDSAFLDYFKGIHIKANSVTNGMMSFNLTSEFAGIFIYYQTSLNTTSRQYQLRFSPFYARVPNLENDPTGSFIERYIDNTNLSDSLVFVQGMTGVQTKLEIPFIDDLKNVVINKAELEVSVATLPGDNLGIFTPVPQILLLRPDEDGNLIPIDDILILQNQQESIFRNAYGGIPIEGTNGKPTVYRMNISSHFQGITDGRNPNILYMSVLNQVQRAARTPLYGVKHPEYAIKLKIAFTRL